MPWKIFDVLQAIPSYPKKIISSESFVFFAYFRCMPPSKAEHLTVNYFFGVENFVLSKNCKKFFLLLFKKQTSSVKKTVIFPFRV